MRSALLLVTAYLLALMAFAAWGPKEQDQTLSAGIELSWACSEGGSAACSP